MALSSSHGNYSKEETYVCGPSLLPAGSSGATWPLCCPECHLVASSTPPCQAAHWESGSDRDQKCACLMLWFARKYFFEAVCKGVFFFPPGPPRPRILTLAASFWAFTLAVSSELKCSLFPSRACSTVVCDLASCVLCCHPPEILNNLITFEPPKRGFP